MNVLSLFDGMSCGQIALERIGIKVDNYYASEVDKYAIKVTMANYPDTIQLGDVRHVTASALLPIHLLIGGSPCQGFSFAGKGLNFEDERSKLFFEYVRLLKECREVNPNVYFLLENVKMKKEHEQVISNILGCKPFRLNSALVSAQNRQRLYWTNIKVNSLPVDKGIMLKDIIHHEEVGVIKNMGQYIERNEKSMCIDANYFKGEYNHGQRTMIKQRRRGFNKGNFFEEKSPTLSSNSWQENNHLVVYGASNNIRKLTPIECERLQTVPDNYTNHVSNTQRYKMLGNGWTADIVAHIFSFLKANQ